MVCGTVLVATLCMSGSFFSECRLYSYGRSYDNQYNYVRDVQQPVYIKSEPGAQFFVQPNEMYFEEEEPANIIALESDMSEGENIILVNEVSPHFANSENPIFIQEPQQINFDSLDFMPRMYPSNMQEAVVIETPSNMQYGFNDVPFENVGIIDESDSYMQTFNNPIYSQEPVIMRNIQENRSYMMPQHGMQGSAILVDSKKNNFNRMTDVQCSDGSCSRVEHERAYRGIKSDNLNTEEMKFNNLNTEEMKSDNLNTEEMKFLRSSTPNISAHFTPQGCAISVDGSMLDNSIDFTVDIEKPGTLRLKIFSAKDIDKSATDYESLITFSFDQRCNAADDNTVAHLDEVNRKVELLLPYHRGVDYNAIEQEL